MTRWCLAIWLVGMLGCGDDDSGADAGAQRDGGDPTEDAGSDANPREDASVDGGAGIEVPANPPMEPLAPDLTPCPSGWAETLIDGTTVCQPVEATSCEHGFVLFPDVPAGCGLVGAPCPDDEWPADLPADENVVFVKADAASGGDGTRGTPYTTIAEAMMAASASMTIAVAKGTYTETDSLRFTGKCEFGRRLQSRDHRSIECDGGRI